MEDFRNMEMEAGKSLILESLLEESSALGSKIRDSWLFWINFIHFPYFFFFKNIFCKICDNASKSSQVLDTSSKV